MRIAYLILCHTDPHHIARLTQKKKQRERTTLHLSMWMGKVIFLPL